MEHPKVPFTHFFVVIGRVGLNPILREKGQVTVFAPTNRAFEALNDGMMDKLLQGDTCLTSKSIYYFYVLKCAFYTEV